MCKINNLLHRDCLGMVPSLSSIPPLLFPSTIFLIIDSHCCLMTMRTASRIGTSDCRAVSRQTLVFIRLGLNISAHLFWHGSSQFVALDFQHLQKGQVAKFSGDLTPEFIAVQPKTTEGCKGGNFGGNGASQSTVSDTEGGEFAESAEFSWEGANDIVGVQPHGDCGVVIDKQV